VPIDIKCRSLSILNPLGPVQASTGIALLLTLPVFFALHCVTGRIINDNELEKIRKEAIIPEFVVVSRDLPGGAEKTVQSSVCLFGALGEFRTRNLQIQDCNFIN
jgi:hypothetical protein